MGNSKIYVGNLSYSVNELELKEMFEPFGGVESTKIITDKDSGKSKGFGFVEMDTAENAKQAIENLNGKEVGGRSITVNEAKPMQPRNNNRGGFGGGNRNRY